MSLAGDGGRKSVACSVAHRELEQTVTQNLLGAVELVQECVNDLEGIVAPARARSATNRSRREPESHRVREASGTNS